MTTPNPTTDRDEAEIQTLIHNFSRALEAKDLESIVRDHAEDIALFDAIAPFRLDGMTAYRKTWEQCLPCFPDSFRSEYHNLQVKVSGDLAFCFGLHRIQPTEGDHPAGQTWLRITVCYQKIDGQWRSVHEHVSVPFNPMTNQAVFLTDVADAGKVPDWAASCATDA